MKNLTVTDIEEIRTLALNIIDSATFKIPREEISAFLGDIADDAQEILDILPEEE